MPTHRKKTTGRRAAATSLAALVLAGCASAPEAESLEPALSPGEPAWGDLAVELHLPDANDPTTYFTLTGLTKERETWFRENGAGPDGWPSLFAVRVEQSVDESTDGVERNPPMLGSYTMVRNGLRFKPRFPLIPGVTYWAVFDTKLGLPHHSWLYGIGKSFTVPRPPTIPTRVAAVYPSTDRLPENQLKFYLHFSAPMSQGEAYEHIHLFH